MSSLINLVDSIIIIIVGGCIILLRKHIFRIFLDYASKNMLNFTDVQQRAVLIIIWVIGIVGVLGGIFRLIKIILKL